MLLRRNGETDRATGVGVGQGWDGDESNVSKLKRTDGGAWERVYLVVLARVYGMGWVYGIRHRMMDAVLVLSMAARLWLHTSYKLSHEMRNIIP